jgi:enterochelin esterase-like enzyme
MDCDDSWTTVGRAGIILDNLIAAKKVNPMVVVMPAGHTGAFNFSRGLQVDEFMNDFKTDIVLYAEKHYRIYTDKQHRALAGLSMGGFQTLNAFENFAYVGVFSSGIIGIKGNFTPQQTGPSWEEQHKTILENPKVKQELKLMWFATGKEDFLLETSRASVELFKKYGFDVTYKETEGAHTWINWREYLNEFAPMLFQGNK